MKKILANWQLYLMIFPPLLYIILFAYKPMYGIVLAFKDFSMRAGIWGSKWGGLDNFKRLFSSYWFPVILKNTLSISLLSLFLGFPIPIIFALMLNEVRQKRHKDVIQTVSNAMHYISTVVICGMIMLFTSPSSGILNKIIEFFGGEAVSFMEEPAYFKWVYVLSGTWQNTGWSSIIYFAALSGVDKSLLEAAEIDGASKFKRIIHINLPLLEPTILILLILQCGSLLSVGYEKVYLLQTDLNIPASDVISTYMYKVGMINSDYSFSTAVSFFNNLVNTSILLIANYVTGRIKKSSFL